MNWYKQAQIDRKRYLEDLAKKRLLNNGKLIKRLYDTGNISNKDLERIGEENDLFRINIFNRECHSFLKKIYLIKYSLDLC